MFASIRKWSLKDPERMASARQEIEEGFIPTLRKQHGFLDYFFVQVGPAQVVTVSVFEDKEGAEASTRFAKDWAAKTIGADLAGPPEIHLGEVLTAAHKGAEQREAASPAGQPSAH